MIMDPQTSRKFGQLVLEAAGAETRHVLADSVSVEIDSSSDTARVTWQCVGTISRKDLARIAQEAQA